MRTASLVVGLCMILALALNVWALQQRTHPEIMQDVAPTRGALQRAIEGGDAAAVVEAAESLQGFFQEVVPIYERVDGMEPAIEFAERAAAAAAEAAAAGRASNLEAAGAAHGNLQGACAACHMQFREKAPDGSWRFKTQ